MESKIKKFKNDARNLYEQFHPSGLCTEKWHMLDHIGVDLRRTGGLRYGDAGIYEYAHTLVKKAYPCGSKRKSNAMDETVVLFERYLSEEQWRNRFGSDANEMHARKRRKLNLEVLQNDCAGLVNNGRSIFISEFRRARTYLRKLRKEREGLREWESGKLASLLDTVHSNSRHLAQDVGEDGSRVLYA